MSLGYGVGEFFALDIGTDALRMVQLSGSQQRGWSLQKFAYVPVDRAILMDSSEAGKRRLGEMIASAANQAGIKTKNIALGIPSSKCFTTIVEVPTQDKKSIEKTIRYHQDQYVPMPIDETQVDYVVLGESASDPKITEVLIAATPIDYATKRMEGVEQFGFNLIALEPEVIAMTRALTGGKGDDKKASVIVELRDESSDLALVDGGAPRLARMIPGGLTEWVRTAANTLGVKEDQARQFILKFGLAQDKLDGQVFRAIEAPLEFFVSEIMKTIQFYGTKNTKSKVEEIILAGHAAQVPYVADYVKAKTGLNVTAGDPWKRVSTSGKQKKALEEVSTEFAVAIGLAERTNLR